MNRGRTCALAVVLACATACGQGASGRRVILDHTGYWRQYCRFGPDRVSPHLLEREGEKLLGSAVLSRAKRAAKEGMRKSGLDPASTDWRQHVIVRFFFDQYPPYVGTLPPAEWAGPQFNDATWVMHRGLILQPEAGRIIPRGPGWTNQDLDQSAFAFLGVQGCYYRARFVVDDPAKVKDLAFSCVYRGGVRVFVNGQETARGHLPGGSAPDGPAEAYPPEAYRDRPEPGPPNRNESRLGTPRDRGIGPVAIPSRLLAKGVNVLAVEVRAAPLHPVVLKMNLPVGNHKVRQGKQGLWAHAALIKAELTTSSAAIRSAMQRPAGVQVWVQDMHHRADSAEFLPPGEPAGTVRFVGPRNGSLSAQLLIGADKPLADLRVRTSDLAGTGPGRGIPASAMQVSFLAPFPAGEFDSRRLGDDRGLGATFPEADTLARWEAATDPSRPCVFDHLASRVRPVVPAGTCQAVWLTLRIPAQTAPGVYQGHVEVRAGGAGAIRLPVRAEVLDWRLPEPKDFQTFVALEQNPYGVAKQYGLVPWSDAHREALAASFGQLARAGNDWLNVPVIARTEFGNRDDSLIRWTRRKDGRLDFDYRLLDDYLDLAIRHCGPPRVVNFVVMQGMRSAARPPAVPFVHVFDEAAGRVQTLKLNGIPKQQKEQVWTAFAKSLFRHMRARNLEKAMFWGYPLEQEDDPELKVLLAKAVPSVLWAANPHEMHWNATYARDRHYGVVTTVRHQNRTPGLRLDQGWRSPLPHLLSPRTGGNVLAMHTTSHPFAYRTLPDHALTSGHSGIGRLGADEWAAIHYDGMGPTRWLTGMPVLFVLWPGTDAADSSVRFEAMVEGIQEAEARIFLEQALEARRLPAGLAERASEVLRAHQRETSFLGGTLCVHELERYHCGWQERSARLYRAAGAVAAAARPRPQ